MKVLDVFLLLNYIFAGISVIAMILRAEKKPVKIFAWTIVLMIPFVGLVAYIYVGKGISTKTKFMLKRRKVKIDEFEHLLNEEVKLVRSTGNNKRDEERNDLVLLNLNNAKSIYTVYNDVKYFKWGKDMLENLLKDLENAKHTINILFYIFATDATGKRVRFLLIKKAKQGVKVKVIYDAVGSMYTYKRFFRSLIKNGGEVETFFPPLFGIRILNGYANYRNHRKIVVIDGKIGYTGGMNLRNDHMGLKRRLSPWRDTHLRIEGPAVYELQNVFLSDWRFLNKKYIPAHVFFNTNYYYRFNNSFDSEKKVGMQVIASSPDTLNQPIKECMIKMIMSAKSNVKIQSPYFVLDDSMKEALILAMLSGVKVEIMFPRIADHKSVWLASLNYLKEMQKYGANIYFYNGFLHSKTLCVDDSVVTVGSCNMDIRSYSLNFEINCVMYGKEIANKQNELFENDKRNSELIKENYFKKMNIFRKIGMKFCNLFSAIF